MPIVIDPNADGARPPVVVCDQCDRPITDASQAIYAFVDWEQATPHFFLHAGDCDHRFWQEQKEPRSGNYPLDAFPLYLARSMGMDVEVVLARLRADGDPLAP